MKVLISRKKLEKLEANLVRLEDIELKFFKQQTEQPDPVLRQSNENLLSHNKEFHRKITIIEKLLFKIFIDSIDNYPDSIATKTFHDWFSLNHIDKRAILKPYTATLHLEKDL